MLCEAVLELISGHIDGMNTPAEEAALQAHLSECEACRRKLASMEAIEFRTRRLRAEPPAQLKANIMQAIQAEAKQKKTSRHSRWIAPVTALGAVAAVLALTLGTGVVKLPQFGSDYARTEAPAAQSAAEVAEDAANYDEIPVASEAEPALTYDAQEPTAAAFAPVDAPAEAEEEAIAETAAPSPWAVAGASTAVTNETAKDSAPILRSAAQAEELDAAAAAYCAELSQRYTVPVLLLRGCDDTLPEALEFLSPELNALLKDAERHELNGKLVLETDVDTAYALAEWLMAVLPQDEKSDPDEDTLAALKQIQCYDPDGNCLANVTEPMTDEALQMLRELYVALYGEKGGIQLFYPSEDYIPVDGDPVYLVLPAKAAD